MNYLLISHIAQIVISLFLILLVLIQYKGKGLTSSIGSSFSFYGSRRGMEKAIFFTTILFAILLAGNSILIILLSR